MELCALFSPVRGCFWIRFFGFNVGGFDSHPMISNGVRTAVANQTNYLSCPTSTLLSLRVKHFCPFNVPRLALSYVCVCVVLFLSPSGDNRAAAYRRATRYLLSRFPLYLFFFFPKLPPTVPRRWQESRGYRGSLYEQGRKNIPLVRNFNGGDIFIEDRGQGSCGLRRVFRRPRLKWYSLCKMNLTR